MASNGTISKRAVTRHAARDAARDIRAAGRAHAKLPLTFLGTMGDDRPEHERGWQPHMWLHPLYTSGAVFLAGQGLNQGVEHGLLPSPVSWIPDGVFTAGCTSLVGVAGGFAGLIATAGERFSDWARAYFALGPVAAGAYLASVAVTSPYSVASLTAVAAGTAVSMGMYWKARQEQDAHELAYVGRWTYPSTKAAAEMPPQPDLTEDLDPDKRRWEAAFNRVGLKGCVYLKKEDTPAGRAVLVGLPRSGMVGPENVDQKLPNIERALGMLKDCLEYDVALSRDGRELSDRCWIHVDVANILEQLLPMPDDDEDHTPQSVNNFFRIGTFMDGKPMTLRFREISALIVGVRGRGKTNLFHVLVHQLSRCIDVVLWAIDLKGGRAVKPWLKPWLDEKVERPVFDWVATTRAEASLMIHAAEALIAHRGNKSKGGSKITPSVHQPGVIVLVDEAAALVGKHSGPKMPVKGAQWWMNPTANQLAAILTSCIQLGRSEAVDFVLCTQRATVSMVGGGDLKSQCEMRIGLGVTNPGDASSVFQSDTVNARKLRKLKNKKTRGACLIENGDDPNHLCGKTFYYGDDAAMLHKINRTATRHAMFPADLPTIEQQAIDDALLALTGGLCGYGVGPDAAGDQRWSMDRAAHLYTDDLAPEWTDDDPGDGEHLGGQHEADNQPRGGRVGTGTATMTRPRSAPPALANPALATPMTEDGSVTLGDLENLARRAKGLPELPAGNRPAAPSSATPPPANETTSRYYTRRRDRAPGQGAAPPEGQQRDEQVARFQQEFDDLVRFLADAPEAEDPYDTSDPEQLTRYEFMVEVIKQAGDAGLIAGSVMNEMVKAGRQWSRRSELHPALNRAKDEGLIVQPLARGRYYWHEFAPGQPPA